MLPVPTTKLFYLADEEKIDVDPADFESRILGMYIRTPLLSRPAIAIRREIWDRQGSTFRTVFAEELGHHFTATCNAVSAVRHIDRVLVSRQERRAIKWAANFLVPTESLFAAAERGLFLPHELAEHFHVDEWLVNRKLEILSHDSAGSGKHTIVREGVFNTLLSTLRQDRAG